MANVDYAKPRTLLEEGSFSNDAENILHLERCPGCEVCQFLVDFYQACDNCGVWGHQRVMEGVVQWVNGFGTATTLCFTCLGRYEKDPESVCLVPPTSGVSRDG